MYVSRLDGGWGCAEARQWLHAIRIIADMPSQVRETDVRVYNSAMGVAARQQDSERALQVEPYLLLPN